MSTESFSGSYACGETVRPVGASLVEAGIEQFQGDVRLIKREKLG